MADPTSADESASLELPFDAPGAGEDLAADVAMAVAAPAAAAEPLAQESSPVTSAAPAGRSAGGRDTTHVKPLKMLVLLTVFAITGVGSLMLLASAMHPGETNRSMTDPISANSAPAAPGTQAPAVSPTVATAKPAATKPSSPTHAPAVESAAERTVTPKWLVSTNARKTGYGGNIAFELAADRDVEVWRKRVRPVLTMRCSARATEVFVVTQSPATIEGNGNLHTVKIGFDGNAPSEQSWEHSIDHDALFAPNGAALMRRIAEAREMTFSYAPFNAPPATVTFTVAGFDAHRKAAGSKCPQLVARR